MLETTYMFQYIMSWSLVIFFCIDQKNVFFSIQNKTRRFLYVNCRLEIRMLNATTFSIECSKAYFSLNKSLSESIVSNTKYMIYYSTLLFHSILRCLLERCPKKKIIETLARSFFNHFEVRNCLPIAAWNYSTTLSLTLAL